MTRETEAHTSGDATELPGQLEGEVDQDKLSMTRTHYPPRHSDQVCSTRPSPQRRLALLALSALALAGTSAAASPSWLSQQTDGVSAQRGADELAQVFLDARTEGSTSAELTERLARQGTPGIPQLFSILQRGVFDVRVGERGNSTKTLTSAEREALLGTLGRLPWTDVQSFLGQMLEVGPLPSQRRAALGVLGACGSARDLPSLLLWSVPEEHKRVPHPLREAFGRALGEILDRDPDALHSIPEVYRSANHSLLQVILGALGERPSDPTLKALSDVLGSVPAADALVLAEIGQVAGVVRHPIDPKVRARASECLERGDRAMLIEGIVAAGRLENPEAVSGLIEFLRHADENVRESAYEALIEITGQTLRQDPEVWARWHSNVKEWWRSEAAEKLRQVSDAQPAAASRAILELSKQRFFRHDIAERLSRGLERDERDLVVLTCAALGHLGSPLSVRPLLACLEDPDVEIRRAAFLALGRITGEDHGEDSQEWFAAGW